MAPSKEFRIFTARQDPPAIGNPQRAAFPTQNAKRAGIGIFSKILDPSASLGTAQLRLGCRGNSPNLSPPKTSTNTMSQKPICCPVCGQAATFKGSAFRDTLTCSAYGRSAAGKATSNASLACAVTRNVAPLAYAAVHSSVPILFFSFLFSSPLFLDLLALQQIRRKGICRNGAADVCHCLACDWRDPLAARPRRHS